LVFPGSSRSHSLGEQAPETTGSDERHAGCFRYAPMSTMMEYVPGFLAMLFGIAGFALARIR
jgi:hypothetical protein